MFLDLQIPDPLICKQLDMGNWWSTKDIQFLHLSQCTKGLYSHMTFEKFHLPHRTISGLRPTAETPRPAHGYIYNGRARILCRFQYHPLITTGKFLQYASHENWSSSTHLGEYVSYGYGIRMPRTVLYLTANWLCRKSKTDRRWKIQNQA